MRSKIRITLPAIAAALVLAVGAVPAGSDEHDEADAEPTVDAVAGSATGGWYDSVYTENDDGIFVETGTAGPGPQVDLPTDGGGPFTDALDELDLYLNGELVTQTAYGLEVSTEGETGTDGYAASSASVAEGFDAELFYVVGLDVECRSDLVNGPTGSTTIGEGGAYDYGAEQEIPLPTNPAPNTVVFDETYEWDDDGGTESLTVRLVLNEQFVDGNTIWVTGATSYFFYEYIRDDGYVSSFDHSAAYGITACGVSTPDVPTPPPTPPAAAAAPAQVTPRFTG